ncbi:MAG: Ig-like domain-containing protein [Acidobacteriota bacterium]
MAFLLLLAVSTAVFVARARPAARAATQTGPEHVLSFAYYSIKGDWDSTLTLNNSSVGELATTVTLYSLDGEALKVPSMSVQPLSNIAVSLSELIVRANKKRGQFQEGSLDVRFNSTDSMPLAPQLTVADANHGLSFDMEPPMMLMSSTLEGLWWSLDKKTSGEVMLSNTTDQDLDVLLNVEWRGNVIPSSPLTLSAHQTTVLEIEKLLKDRHVKAEGIERGGLSISHNGLPGALIAHGVIQNKDARFASNLPFVDPSLQKNSVLNGAGLMLGRPASGSALPEASFFTPKLALKNALSTSQRATITVNYTTDGVLRSRRLSPVSLAPHEVRMADLSVLMSEVRNSSISAAGVKIESTGAPGSLVAALSSVDGSQNADASQKGGQSENSENIEVDVPLVSRSERSGEGGNHPFRLGESFRSVAYLTNITQKPTKVAVIIFHQAAMFTPELISVAPGETIAIDLLQLRDSQAKDIQNRTLPANLTEGQFFWHPHQAEALIGRIVTFDKASSTASNFSCPNCCQLEPGRIDILPSPITGAIGDFCQLTVYEWDTYCGQFQVGPYNYTNSVAYSCDNSSVATVNSTGGVSCMGLGNATITVSFDYYHSDYISGEDCGLFVATAYTTAPVAVTPLISGPVTLWWFNGYSPSGYATEITLTASPGGAGAYAWAIVAGTDFVNYSNNSDNMTTSTNQVVVRSTGQSVDPFDIKVRVTVNGVQSQKFALVSKAPYSLGSAGEDHQPDAARGYRTFIYYQILDQFTNVLPSNVPISEFFTTPVIADFPGMNWTGGQPNSLVANPAGFADTLAPPALLTNYPESRPPCIPLCDVRVNHNEGSFHVGTLNIGQGLRVQTHTWQFYTDHGAHQNRISPAPL